MNQNFEDPSFLPNLQEVYEFFGQGSKGDAAFHNFCKTHKIYEFLTQEFVETLANYLEKRILELRTIQNRDIKILEVCAGDGRLTHFLKLFLDRTIPDQYSITASDSGEWSIHPLFPVMRISHQQALDQIQPDIVVCSWMPKGKDLTRDFRMTPSMREYLLIGNPQECGDPWLTWGEKSNKTSAFEQDGFQLTMFGKEFPKQLCMDSLLNSPKQSSWMYRFSKKVE